MQRRVRREHLELGEQGEAGRQWDARTQEAEGELFRVGAGRVLVLALAFP